MNPIAVVLAAAIIGEVPPPKVDFDEPVREQQTSLDSPHIRDMLTAAMALPYGVSRMPCRAQRLQPLRGWKAVREPSGKISWLEGPVARAKWSGIYGTCFIESPRPREVLGEGERAALECECNGWLPEGVKDYPLP